MATEEVIGGGGMNMGGTPPAADPGTGGGTGGTGDQGTGTGGTGGSQTLTWQEAVGDVFKDNAAGKETFTKEFTNDQAGVAKLAKNYTELQKQIGQKGLTKLPEDATDAQKAEWQKTMNEIRGVPADIKGYGDLPAEMDGVKADTALRGEFLKAAHEAGLDTAQVQKMDKFAFAMTKIAADKAAAVDKEFATQATNLWGQNTDATLNQGKALIAANVPAGLKPLIDKVDNNSLILLTAALTNQQKSLGAEDVPNKNGTGAAGGKTATDLHSEKLELMKSKAYNSPMDPQHKEVTARVLELNDQVVKMKQAGQK